MINSVCVAATHKFSHLNFLAQTAFHHFVPVIHHNFQMALYRQCTFTLQEYFTSPFSFKKKSCNASDYSSIIQFPG